MREYLLNIKDISSKESEHAHRSSLQNFFMRQIEIHKTGGGLQKSKYHNRT